MLRFLGHGSSQGLILLIAEVHASICKNQVFIMLIISYELGEERIIYRCSRILN